MNISSPVRAVSFPLLFCGTIFLIACGSQSTSPNGGQPTESFTLSAQTSSLTLHPGDQNIPVTIAAPGTGSTPIAISVANLPSGVTASALSLTPGTSGTLALSASVAADQEDFPPTAPTMVTARSRQLTITGTAGSAQTTAHLTLSVSISNPSFAPAPSAINLPVVNINTSNTPITSKTVDVPGTITITSANGQTTYLPSSSDTDNTATFHVHGNSTAEMPKLAYHVKLNTSTDLLVSMGLTCPYVTGSGKPTCDKSKSYILLANYDDKTFLRDWAASALANAIPMGGQFLTSPPGSPTPSGTSQLMPWAPHSLFVELYLNGAYEGNYQLIEEVKIDSHRVNITEMAQTATSGSPLTGGYLLEIDKQRKEDFMFNTPGGLPIGLVDPDYTPEVPEQTSYISNYVDTAWHALFSPQFTDPTVGWRAYFDEAAAVNFYLVNDLMGNEDGGNFESSDYFYKDMNNPLLYMGPVWDFDISAGNVNYKPDVNPTVPWMAVQASWYVQWFKDPGFHAAVAQQWNALNDSGVLMSWYQSIFQEQAALTQSAANNFARWPILGIKVWPNAEAAGSYNGEVNYMTSWLMLRADYFDSLFNSKAPTSVAFTAPAGTLRQGSSITLTAQVTGSGVNDGSLFFLGNNIVLGYAPVNQSGSGSLTITNLPSGTESLQAVYGGDATNALSLSTVHSVTVLPPSSSSSVASSSVTIASPPPDVAVLAPFLRRKK